MASIFFDEPIAGFICYLLFIRATIFAAGSAPQSPVPYSAREFFRVTSSATIPRFANPAQA